jgi:hypothetical protein
MSVLADFMRMRLYRKRAVELEKAAEGCLPSSVRERYLAAAAHYWQIADAEEQAERATALNRLVHGNEKTSKRERFARATAYKVAFRRTPLGPTDLMEEVVRALLKRAAKNAPPQRTWPLAKDRAGDQDEIVSLHKLIPFPLARGDIAPLRTTSFARRTKTRVRP